MIEIRHLSSQVLFTARDAKTTKDAVIEATTWGADLGGADLRDACLGGANLRDACLGGAYLGGAARSDGYFFFLQQLKDDTEPMVKAGCRYFTLTQAQEHWEKTRKGEKLLDETKLIIGSMVALAKVRGYIK